MNVRLGAAILFVSAGCATMNQPSTPPASTPPPGAQAEVTGSERGVIPVGQLLDVRLSESLSSDTATVEQRFQTTTLVDLVQGDNVLVPAGSIIRGQVSHVSPAGKIDRSGSLTELDRDIPQRWPSIRCRSATGTTTSRRWRRRRSRAAVSVTKPVPSVPPAWPARSSAGFSAGCVAR